MRYKRLFTLLYLLITVSAYSQVNRALIVAIDEYPMGSGWNKIHSLNDVTLIKPTLTTAGYDEEDITVLANEQAVKKAITEHLSNLKVQSGKGDYIYIHFSCHGQQMVDDNGDEDDGLDEAVIPYDAKRKYQKGYYEGENHLRDNELGIVLDDIRKKTVTDGSVIVVIDACHSATGTRHELDYEKLQLLLTNDTELSPVHIFSACREDERNFEFFLKEDNIRYGFLTYIFTLLQQEWKEKRISYSRFYDLVKDKAGLLLQTKKWKQTPTFESTDGTGIFKIAR